MSAGRFRKLVVLVAAIAAIPGAAPAARAMPAPARLPRPVQGGSTPITSFPGAVTASLDDVLATVQLPEGMRLGSIAVDDARRRVYLSDSHGDAGIVVVDFDGHLLSPIPAHDAFDMAVDPDASRLYVAERGADRIRVLDLTTEPPSEQPPIPVGAAAPLVGQMALTAGRLWFFYGHCGRWDTGMASASVDPRSPEVRTYRGEALSDLYCGLNLAVAPERPGYMLGWDAALYPSHLDAFDVSGNDPRLLASSPQPLPHGPWRVGLDAAGTVVEAPFDEGVTPLDATTLEPIGQACFTEGVQTSVLSSPDGETVAIGTYVSSRSVWTVDVGGGVCRQRNDFVLGDSRKGAGIAPRTAQQPEYLAQSADGSRLFTTTRDFKGISLEIVDDPWKGPTRLSVEAAPWAASPGDTLEVSGSIAFGAGDQPTDPEVAVLMRRPDGSSAEIGRVPIDAAGQWRMTSPAMTDPGFVTFTAVYPGDDEHRRGSAEVTVQVRGARAFGRDVTTSVGTNPAHTGSLAADALQPPLALAWIATLPDAAEPALVTPRSVLVSAHARLSALDPKDGTVRWGPVAVGSEGMPTFARGMVFTGGASGVVDAVDASTGEPLWSRDLDLELGDPVASQGLVFVHASTALVALDQHTGAVRWSRQFDWGGTSPPIAVRGAVSINDFRWQVHAYDLRGRPLAHEGGGFGASAQSAAYGGRLYLRENGWGQPGVIRDSDGTVVRQFTASAPLAFHDGMGFFVQGQLCPDFIYATECWLEAQDLDTGGTVWRFTGDRKIYSAPVVVGDVVYVASKSGWVYGFEADTGRIVASVNFGVPVNAAGESEAPGLTAGQGLLLVSFGNQIAALRSAAATLSSNVASLTFGKQSRSGLPLSRSVEFRSTGATETRIDAVSITGPHRSDFRILTNECLGALLATGETCSVTVEFHPRNVGLRTARLRLADTAAGSPQTLSLRGTGT